MLPGAQTDLCLTCHDSRTKADRAVTSGVLAPGARPLLLGTTLAQPFTHPLSDGTFSRREPDVVTCTSCHSPHRRSSPTAGVRKVSTRDPNRLEFELCGSCHDGPGLATEGPLAIGRLLDPDNRSYHPVEGPAAESSASVRPGLSGREIDCTDCHGNSDPAGSKGPHGSPIQFILRENYLMTNGNEESLSSYALCYGCHDRDQVLDSLAFPLHRKHVAEERASCSACHDAHGSVENRALVHIGEDSFATGVTPSIQAGVLLFLSTGPGAGECYLTCHGRDHAPEVYGGAPPGGSLTPERSPLPGARAKPLQPLGPRP
jgi:predicted CXXCH cytochrome family protein